MTPLNLIDDDLPGFYKDASKASAKGQTSYLRFSRARFAAAICAAVGGAFAVSSENLDWFALVALSGFIVALIADIYLAIAQPERDWYAGRALAESTKTLAWRYSVRGAPFAEEIPEDELRALLRSRFRQVSERGRDRITILSEKPVVTKKMESLRDATFAQRKEVYIRDRTLKQRIWYTEKAECNSRRAKFWRLTLITGEVIATVLASLRLRGDVNFDFAGILAAGVTASAAWLALKQHSQLASAYRIAARELAIQEDALQDTTEENWPQAVADAEEAISREHTMWLASRGEE